jgi:hypothetical protein
MAAPQQVRLTGISFCSYPFGWAKARSGTRYVFVYHDGSARRIIYVSYVIYHFIFVLGGFDEYRCARPDCYLHAIFWAECDDMVEVDYSYEGFLILPCLCVQREEQKNNRDEFPCPMRAGRRVDQARIGLCAWYWRTIFLNLMHIVHWHLNLYKTFLGAVSYRLTRSSSIHNNRNSRHCGLVTQKHVSQRKCLQSQGLVLKYVN